MGLEVTSGPRQLFLLADRETDCELFPRFEVPAMTTKIGPSISPALTSIRSEVERPVQQAQPEATLASYTPVDGFESTQGPRNDSLLGNSPNFTAGQLKSSLTPFQDALDNIANTLDPAVLNDKAKLGQAIMDAVKALGIV